jgi:hypothetical protein
MDGRVLNLRIELEADAELDDEQRERMARQLRAEVVELDVESVTTAPTGPPPPGAKGDPVTIGALVVALGAAGGALPELIATLRSWLERRAGRNRISVTIDGDTLELENTTEAQRQDLVRAYVQRHAQQPGVG